MITENMARVFGLRIGNPTDERLGRLLLNPRTACRERFIYGRGTCALYVGGMYLVSVDSMGSGKRWLSDAAARVPELVHLKSWAEKLG